ncbi:MAG: protealysin inhibitor emfourin [Acidimicrobiales bacterium]
MGTHIDFARSGGLAGLTMGASVDTDSLPPDVAATVNGALGKVDLGALAGRGGQPSGADRFQYDLRVSGDAGSHSITLQESEVPGELRPLIDALMPLASPR